MSSFFLLNNFEVYSQFISENNFQNIISKNTIFDTIATQKNLFNQFDYSYNNSKYYYTVTPQFEQLVQNTKIFAVSAISSIGILYLMPENVTNWDKTSMNFNNIFSKWKKNIAAGPVVDKDDWMLNYLAHPYCGAIYYTSARSLEYSILASFLYSATMSTFAWEYGFEAFAEVPSVQDLIITPICGSILGELFYITKKNIVQKNYEILNSKTLGHCVVFLLDPFNEVSGLISPKNKITDSLTNKNSFRLSLASQFTINKINKLEYCLLVSARF